MKKSYKIEEFDSTILVLPNGSVGLDILSESVKKHLIKKGYEGSVFFDMLVLNGLNNRFLSIEFKNNRFDYLKAKEVKLKDGIVEFSNTYYSKHSKYIVSASLSRIEKQKISSYLNSLSCAMA